MTSHIPRILTSSEGFLIASLIGMSPGVRYRVKKLIFQEHDIINVKNAANMSTMQIRSYRDGRVRIQMRRTCMNKADLISTRFVITDEPEYRNWKEVIADIARIHAHMTKVIDGPVVYGRIKAISVRPPNGVLPEDIVLARRVVHHRCTVLKNKPAMELTLTDGVKVLLDSSELGNRVRHLHSGAIFVVNRLDRWNLYNRHRFEGVFDVIDSDDFFGTHVREAVAA